MKKIKICFIIAGVAGCLSLCAMLGGKSIYTIFAQICSFFGTLGFVGWLFDGILSKYFKSLDDTEANK